MQPPINLRGRPSYHKLRKDIQALLGTPDPHTWVTTMVDLFNLPGDFPGRVDCDAYTNPRERVKALEERFAADIADPRFMPYLQLHEFEALVLADLISLAKFYPHRETEIRKLARSLDRDFQSPEHVNRLTPPSYRIRQAVPEYDKRVAGVITLLEIGLDRIRSRCKHFDRWLTSMEGLSAQPGAAS